MDSHLKRNLASALAVLAILIAFVEPHALNVVNASSPTEYGSAMALVVSQSCPSGITVDSSGTVYWVNRCSGQLLELPRRASFPSEILSGLNDPYGVGIDAAGNVYFDEYFRGTLSILAPGSRSPQTLLSGLNYPNYMSVDSAGDIYFITGQTCGDRIVRFDASSHAVTTLLVAPQPHDPNHGFGGLFVDPSGDLYYTTCDYLTLNLLRSGSSLPSTFLNTTSRPMGIVVDTNGNVYYALYNDSINELAAGTSTPVVLTRQGSARLQLAIDESGNLYYTDDIGGRIWEIPSQNSANAGVTVSTTTTATSTVVSTSVLPSTVVLTSISSNTQTVSVAPSTITLTSVSSITQTTTQTSTGERAVTTQTSTISITEPLTTSIKETTTSTTVLVQYTNGSPYSSIAVIGLVLAVSILTAYVVLSSRRRTIPRTAQLPVDRSAVDTIDGIVMKYVSDHGGEISISTASTDLGIAEPQLRQSLKRLLDKGLLSK